MGACVALLATQVSRASEVARSFVFQKLRGCGMDVAGFESTTYFGFVVSDLGQNEIVQLAGALAPALRNALNRSTGSNIEAGAADFIVPPFVGSDLAHIIRCAVARLACKGQRRGDAP
jgi:hypothetical protein